MITRFVTPFFLAFVVVGAGWWYLRGGGEVSAELSSAGTIVSLQTTATPEGGMIVGDQNDVRYNAPVAPVSVPEGFVEYRNIPNHFSLWHPKGLTIKHYDESGGAQTITFTDAVGGKEFQIFVLPYHESVITPERFKLDQPSGVYREPVTVTIDNTQATMFFSENLVMGATREVWFIKDGALYEVTTYKELDGWLAEIMATWRFL